MTKSRFLSARRPAWRRFEELLGKSEGRRTPKFSGTEVAEFSRLFRSLCYDLSVIRSRDWGRGIEDYLNDLVARGHNNFYRSPPGKPREVLRFFTAGFPRLLRANIAYFLVSLALFTVPGTIAGIAIGFEPALASRVLPGTMLAEMEMMHSGDRERVGGSGAEAAATGFYIFHNIGIAFRCFATGILCGVGTVFFLVYNSIVLGTVSAYLTARGHANPFFSFVISHGSFELTAIVIAGAAGLILGHAVVHPGSKTRAAALRDRGLAAVKLAAGAGAMLAVAAFIEAFWSPFGAPSAAKFIVGGALWILVISYLTLAGRERRTE